MGDVDYRVAGRIATLTIDRPEARNAMTFEVMRELREGVADARADEAVGVLVLAGAGDRAFCAGADLTGLAANSGVAAAHEARGELADLFRDLWALGKPTIARVQGFALAGGFGLAMACDFVIAAEEAQFGTPEVNVGLWPFMITVPLLRAMPPRVVLELMATGRRMDATEAKLVGIVNRVVSKSDLDDAVQAFADDLASKSPLIMRLGRTSFYRALEMSSDDALDYLQSMLSLTTMTDDAAEGVAAFVEKREPTWRGH